MRIFLRIITFPLRLAVLIIAFILRAILTSIGSLIALISGSAAGVCGLLAILSDVLAIGITIYAIDEIKTGAISLLTGICCMAFFWIVAFILDSIWIVGYVIGEFLINIGATLTDLALELLKL